MVYGASACEYAITIVSDSSNTILHNGIPASGDLPKDSYAYFSIYAPYEKSELLITLTPSEGDPDLFVSNDGKKPNTTNYIWSSEQWGGDIILIDYNDENFKMGWYDIAVYAWTNASYTITAVAMDLNAINSDSSTITLLVEGMPQMGLLDDHGDVKYYKFYLQKDLPLSLAVTSFYGDPDLYVQDNYNGEDIPENLDDFKWTSKEWGRDSLAIDDGCNDCWYLIGVSAFSHTLYSLSASTVSNDTSTWLLDGIPSEGNVKSHSWAYYEYRLKSAGELDISLTSLSGDPDIYIRLNEFPTLTDYLQKSVASGNDVLELEDANVGVYYIGVYGWEESSFLITAMTKGGVIQLIDSNPHTDNLAADEIRHYTFTVRDVDEPILFNAVFSFGDGDFFVRNDGELPTEDNYQWSSANVSSTDLRNTLTIPSDDGCESCTYDIIMKANSECLYTLTASIGSKKSILLSDGVAYNSYGDENEYKYFAAYIDGKAKDIQIDVTVYLGDIDIYASFDTNIPTSSSYTWSLKSSDNKDKRGAHLSIDKDDEKFQIGILYIGIKTNTHSRYSITVSTKNVMLNDGVPVHATIPATGINYYFFNLQSDNTDIVFDFSGNRNDKDTEFDVYITTDPTISQPNHNTQSTWMKKVKYGQHLIILKTDPAFCGMECTYYIGIEGTIGKNYELKATTDQSYQMIIDQSTINGMVSYDTYRYYETFADVVGNFTVTLETCYGNTDLYISQSTYKPNSKHITWSSTNTGQIDSISIQDSDLSQVGFYIGVYGEDAMVKHNDYELTVTVANDDDIKLIPIPGNRGILQTSLDPSIPDQISVSFYTASLVDNTDKKLTYKLYYQAQNSYVAIYSYCGLQMSYLADTYTKEMLKMMLILLL